MNINFLIPAHNGVRLFNDIFEAFKLKQVINYATRVTQTSILVKQESVQDFSAGSEDLSNISNHNWVECIIIKKIQKPINSSAKEILKILTMNFYYIFGK